jgi:P27 family predicted phage terminase small subunit
VPTPPKPLEGDALQEWLRMVDRLTELGTLTALDDAILYQHCRLFADTEAIAVSQLEVAGSVTILEENIGDMKGADLVAAFQEISKLRQLEARYTSQIRQRRLALRTFLVELGLTPSARGRVKLPVAPAQADPLAALLSRRNATR